MTMDVARFKARQSAYQWRMPCWIVLDALARGLVSSVDRTRSTWRANRIGSSRWRSTTPKDKRRARSARAFSAERIVHYPWSSYRHGWPRVVC